MDRNLPLGSTSVRKLYVARSPSRSSLEGLEVFEVFYSRSRFLFLSSAASRGAFWFPDPGRRLCPSDCRVQHLWHHHRPERRGHTGRRGEGDLHQHRSDQSGQYQCCRKLRRAAAHGGHLQHRSFPGGVQRCPCHGRRGADQRDGSPQRGTGSRRGDRNRRGGGRRRVDEHLYFPTLANGRFEARGRAAAERS